MSLTLRRTLALVSATALAVVALPAATAQAFEVIGCPDNYYEPDDTMDTAWYEPSLPTWTGHAFCVGYDQDWVAFHTEPNYHYTIETVNLAPDVDTVLSMYRGGTEVVTSDNFNGAKASRIDYSTSVSETVYLKLRNFGDIGGNTFTYDLRISSVYNPPPPPVDPPEVTILEPAQNAPSAPVANDVRVTFDEQVGGISGSTFQLLDHWWNVVPADVGYNPTLKRAWLNPHANLIPNATYYPVLNHGIYDMDWNELQPTSWSFKTANAPQPIVSAVTPAANATGVAVGANTTATFSEPVVGVTGSSFQIRGPTGALVPAAVSYNATSRVATLNPGANLAELTTYKVSLTGGSTNVRSAATGMPLVSAEWYFTTEQKNPAPYLIGLSPIDGAQGVARTTNVTATFSEPVVAANGTNVKLTTAAGAAVAATVTYNATTRTVTLNPGPTLAANTKYRVTLKGGSTGIRDTTNKPLVLNPTTWTFTTGR